MSFVCPNCQQSMALAQERDPGEVRPAVCAHCGQRVMFRIHEDGPGTAMPMSLGATPLSADRALAGAIARRAIASSGLTGTAKAITAAGAATLCLEPEVIEAGAPLPDERRIADALSVHATHAAYSAHAEPNERGGSLHHHPVPQEAATGCANHPTVAFSWRCAACGMRACALCAAATNRTSNRRALCPRCGSAWSQSASANGRAAASVSVSAALAYPFSGWGPIMWVMFVLISWAVPWLGLTAGTLLGFFLLAYGMKIVKDSSEGGTEPPDWPEFSSWWEIVGRGVRGVVCLAVAAAPLAALLVFMARISPAGIAEGSGGRGALVLAGLIAFSLLTASYFPMAFLIACLFDTFAPALNPAVIFRAIGRIPGPYAAVVAAGLCLAGASAAATWSLRPIPVFGSLAAAAISSYALFVQFHMLGRLAHLCEARLEWTPAIH